MDPLIHLQQRTVCQCRQEKELDEKGVYEMYYAFSEPIHKIVSHRILATNRGEKEDILKVSLQVDESAVLSYLERQMIKDPDSPAAVAVREAYQDSYKRFIQPAIEREVRNELTEKQMNKPLRFLAKISVTCCYSHR